MSPPRSRQPGSHGAAPSQKSSLCPTGLGVFSGPRYKDVTVQPGHEGDATPPLRAGVKGGACLGCDVCDRRLVGGRARLPRGLQRPLGTTSLHDFVRKNPLMVSSMPGPQRTACCILLNCACDNNAVMVPACRQRLGRRDGSLSCRREAGTGLPAVLTLFVLSTLFRVSHILSRKSFAF